jgi:hypothetical protein
MTDQTTAAAAKPFKMIPTTFKHVYHVDVNDNGQLREVAIVKEWQNGSLDYIDIALLDNFDKGRLKKVITSQHADKYELWELLLQETLSNGKNGLQYFQQVTKQLKAPGHMDSVMGGQSGLVGARVESNAMVGSQFTDPGSGVIDSQHHA